MLVPRGRGKTVQGSTINQKLDNSKRKRARYLVNPYRQGLACLAVI